MTQLETFERALTIMSQASYPLKLPASVSSCCRLAKEVGVSLNQWIALAIAQKISAVETASDFLNRRAGQGKPGRYAAISRQGEARSASGRR